MEMEIMMMVMIGIWVLENLIDALPTIVVVVVVVRATGGEGVNQSHLTNLHRLRTQNHKRR